MTKPGLNIDNLATKLKNEVKLASSIFPNPTNGSFTFKTDATNLNRILYIYGLDGKLYYQTTVTETNTRLSLNLEKGLYIVVYNNETLKLTLH
jgi:hypothetical protein